MRDGEQARLTDHAYEEAQRLLDEASRRRSTGSPMALLDEGDDRPRGAAGDARRRRGGVALAETVGTVRVLDRAPRPSAGLRSNLRGAASVGQMACQRRRGARPTASPTRCDPAGRRRRAARGRARSASRGRCGVDADEPGRAQRGEMLRDRLPGDGQLGRELGRRGGAARGERLDDEAPARVGERREDERLRDRARGQRLQPERRAPLGDVSRTCTRVPPSTSSSRSSTTPSSSQRSTRRSSGSTASTDGAPLLAVVPAEHAAATRSRVELDVVREPLLEPLLVGQRRPDVLARRRQHDLSLDLHAATSRLRI